MPATTASARTPQPLLLRLEATQRLTLETHHVQGLSMTDSLFYFTSVDRWRGRAWLFVLHREGTVKQRINLTENRLIHPGGISLDDKRLWIPNAEYRRGGRTKILALDPTTLAQEFHFVVDDHVSLVASDPAGRLYGTNWGSKHFYVWDHAGQLLEKVPNPTKVAYQDCQYEATVLWCAGHRKKQGYLDLIDPKTWQLLARAEVGRTTQGKPLSYEGFSWHRGDLYFLPEDAPHAALYHFSLDPLLSSGALTTE